MNASGPCGLRSAAFGTAATNGGSPGPGRHCSTCSGRPPARPSAISRSIHRAYLLVLGVPALKHANINHSPSGAIGPRSSAAPARSSASAPKLIAPWRARCSAGERHPPRGAPSPWLRLSSTCAAPAAPRKLAGSGSASSLATIVAGNSPASRDCISRASATHGRTSPRIPASVAAVAPSAKRLLAFSEGLDPSTWEAPVERVPAALVPRSLLLYALDEQVRRYEVEGRVRRFEHHEFVSLVRDDNGACRGVVVMDLRRMQLQSFPALAVALATGGPGLIFGKSTNSSINTGTAASAAYQQGAEYGNGEFIQVHPTAIPGADKLRLISESARGEGGRAKALG